VTPVTARDPREAAAVRTATGASRGGARRIATPPAPGARRATSGPPAASGSGAPPPSTLELVVGRLVARLAVLEAQLDAGHEGVWPDYLEAARTLAAILPLLAPGQLLTTAELAAQLGISPKTLRRRKALGLLQPALQHGRLFRWRDDQGVR
jgi:hypothetical protein